MALAKAGLRETATQLRKRLDRNTRSVFLCASFADGVGWSLSNWLLGHQDRSALPEELVVYLEQAAESRLVAITWVEPDRLQFTAHYMKGCGAEQRVFRYAGVPRERLNGRVPRFAKQRSAR